MAQYKYKDHVTQSDSPAFETRYAAGAKVQNPGIYRCLGCGDEIVAAKNQILPTTHQHPGDGKVEWQLLVFAQQSR
jgi:hypothetical protein